MVEELGAVIREIRERYGLTQRNLAERMEISRSTVSIWERDERLPSCSYVDRLAHAFPYYRSVLYVTARSLPLDLSPKKKSELLMILDFE